MTEQEKREGLKVRLKKQLKGKVRKHRPAEKVLALEVMMCEDQIEIMDKQREVLEWTAEYLRNLDPTEIEPDKQEEIKLNDIV